MFLYLKLFICKPQNNCFNASQTEEIYKYQKAPNNSRSAETDRTELEPPPFVKIRLYEPPETPKVLTDPLMRQVCRFDGFGSGDELSQFAKAVCAIS